MPTIVFCWGVALCGMAASTNYASLVATRFLLGLFEAACLPLFAVITTVWYRRAEQPLRICMWYGTNGFGTMIGSAMSYGLGHIKSEKLHSYQIIFLVTGLITVVTPAWIAWKLDNNVGDARFLTPVDRKKAAERVKANKTGINATSNSYQWSQALEACLELKTWLFVFMTLLLNIGASVSNVFGPLILAGIGFDKYKTSLLNIPFGAVQLLVIVIASYVAWRFSRKSYMLMGLVLPVIVGLALLYTLPVSSSNTGPLLFGYYLIACLFGANPLIISWISANTAGSTKKSVTLSAYNAASAAGNIIGPYMFKESDAPRYLPGLKACLGIFVALFCCIALQVVNLTWLNRKKTAERIRQGKPANPHDVSMDLNYHGEDADVARNVAEQTAGQDDRDLTDKQNDMFVYVL
jgi:MFS family permease